MPKSRLISCKNGWQKLLKIQILQTSFAQTCLTPFILIHISFSTSTIKYLLHFFFIAQNSFKLKKVSSVLYSMYENKKLINQAVKQTFWMEIVFKVAPIKHVHLSVNYIGQCAPFAESFEICQIFLWHADVWWSETSYREYGNMQQSKKKKNKSGNKMFGALSVVASTIYFFIQNTPSWIVWWLFFALHCSANGTCHCCSLVFFVHSPEINCEVKSKNL